MPLIEQEEIEYLQLLEAERYDVCQQSLAEFIKDAWHTIEPNTPYKHNWHIDLITEYMEAITQGQLRRLIINLPFRYGKSLLSSVFFPCWEWIRYPAKRWFFASYAQDLSTELSLKRRRVIQSQWYQAGYGKKYKVTTDQNTKTWVENDRQGVLLATSVGGSGTGRGGDRLVIDDPCKAEEAFSGAKRKTVNDWFDNTFSTRLNNRDEGAIILIMHRVHPQDLTGHIIKKELEEQYCYQILSLPLLAERQTVVTYPMSGRVNTRQEGDVLWEAKDTKLSLKSLRADIGIFAWNAQCQQNPQELKGNMVDRAWWQYYRELPPEGLIYQSWDTALETSQTADYSVCITAMAGANRYYITDVWRQKVEAPDLERAFKQLYDRDKPVADLVERKASGYGLIQSIKRSTLIPVIPVDVDRDKVARLNAVIGLIESGRVCLPESASWVADFVDEVSMFPNGQNDDMVDALTQVLAYMRTKSIKQEIIVSSTAQTTEELMQAFY